MGILSEPQAFITQLGLAPGFSVCELGNQFITNTDIHYPAEVFYRKLGCGRYESLDANGRGTQAVDLNVPVRKQLRIEAFYQRFDLVTDFGTGEHVFNQFEIWRGMHELCRPGGFIVFDRPSHGYEGHCFYLIQWNLISALANANDYVVVRLEERETTRGLLIRGVLKKVNGKRFQVPQQGRYVKDLVVDKRAQARGPDHKNQQLRKAGVIISRHSQ